MENFPDMLLTGEKARPENLIQKGIKYDNINVNN